MPPPLDLKVAERTSRFRCDVQHPGGGVVSVVLAGELDMATVGELDRALRAVETHAHSGLLIDLRGLTFLDGSGLRLLVELARRTRATGVRLSLVGGSHAVDRIFEVTGLDRVLPLVGLRPAGDAALAPRNVRR